MRALSDQMEPAPPQVQELRAALTVYRRAADEWKARAEKAEARVVELLQPRKVAMGSDLSDVQWNEALAAGWVDEKDTRIRELESEVVELRQHSIKAAFTSLDRIKELEAARDVILTEAQAVELLRKLIEDAGSIRKLVDGDDSFVGAISNVLQGKRPVTMPQVLDLLGLEVVFRVKERP